SADVERCETDETTDAVVFVHDRRAGPQIGKVADDLFGIALGAASATFLTRALAEQLLFRDQCERWFGEHHARRDRRYRDAERLAALDESRPAVDQLRPQGPLLQDVQQHLAASGRLGRNQHAAMKIAQEAGEL